MLETWAEREGQLGVEVELEKIDLQGEHVDLEQQKMQTEQESWMRRANKTRAAGTRP